MNCSSRISYIWCRISHVWRCLPAVSLIGRNMVGHCLPGAIAPLTGGSHQDIVLTTRILLFHFCIMKEPLDLLKVVFPPCIFKSLSLHPPNPSHPLNGLWIVSYLPKRKLLLAHLLTRWQLWVRYLLLTWLLLPENTLRSRQIQTLALKNVCCKVTWCIFIIIIYGCI